MTPTEAFKVGFLLKCAEQQLTPEQTRQKLARAYALVKVAWLGADTLGKLFDSLKFWTVAAPPIAGLIGGYGAAQFSGDSSATPPVAKKQEEISEYQRAIEELTRGRQRQFI
jgi:hypothetical protein